MKTYTHKEAENIVRNYNRDHQGKLFQKVVVGVNKKFSVMSITDAIVCHLNYEYFDGDEK